MSYEPKDGDISLFPNDKKTSDNSPSMRGSLLWNGEKLKISVWTKGEGAKKFLSGRVEVDTYVKQGGTPTPTPVQEEETSDFPF